MSDATAAQRVRRYRQRQKTLRKIARVELQVPFDTAGDIKRLGRKLRDAIRAAHAHKRELDFVLGTVNAPRPVPIDGETLIRCLLTSEPEARWRPHVEALFDEVSEEAVHDLVLARILDFEDLYRAARTWRVTHGRIVPWIAEMADLRLAGAAA